MTGLPNHVSPDPTPEEAVAIAVAIEYLWPRAVLVAPPLGAESAPNRWRFSGRWWSKPTAARRDRP